MTDLVIGSGPAGISVARALLARGRQVVMLDAGRKPDTIIRDRIDKMAGTDPEGWSNALRADWQQPQFETPPGQVRRFGSDFAMEPAERTLTSAQGFGLRASQAAGGLSNLWGSAVLPYQGRDISDWPITADDLAPHYQAVAGFMPISGKTDDLETLLPAMSMQGRHPLSPSVQARKLLQRLERKKAQLGAIGVHAGMARLAVDGGCKFCGQCLHGCPWGYIWSARHTLETLRQHPGFEYHRGVALDFEETGEGVIIRQDGGKTLTATRVFIASGVLETARILLRSTPPATGQLSLRDSQHFFLPALHPWGTGHKPDRPPYHTLPQAFMEIADPKISPHLIHSQIYTWNEFYARELNANYGAKLPGSAPIWNALARRLIVTQAFLHSQHSARIDLSLASDGRLTPSIVTNPETATVMASARNRLSRALRFAGLVPLGFANRPGIAGSSFHVGGSVPMASTPRSGQADILGRPHGLSRVHLVDASVFPTIPSTTITFSVMANAHRIGTLAP